MTIKHKIRIINIFIVAFVLATVMILFWGVYQVEEGIKTIETTSKAIDSAFRMRIHMEKYMADGDESDLRRCNKHSRALGQIIDKMSIDSLDPVLLANLKNSYETVKSLFSSIVKMEVSKESDEYSQDSKARDLFAKHMLLQSEQLITVANDLNRESQLVTSRKRKFVQDLIVILGLSMVIIVLINIYLIRKSVVNPLKIFSQKAEKIGKGDFDYISEIKSNDELGKLAGAFNTMIESIKTHAAALKKAKDELELEIEKRTSELKAASAYNRTLIEASLDPMVAISMEGKIIDVNTAAEKASGFSRDELIGTDFVDHVSDPKTARVGFKRVLKEGMLKDYELEMRHNNGCLIPVIFSASVYRDEFGQIAGIIATARDITERKEAEKIRKKALETADILSKIFSTTHFCIALLDKNFNFISVNQAYADKCGYAPEFFPGKNHFDLYPHEENEAIFRHVVETGERFTVYAKPFEFPDQPDRGITYWDWTLHPLKDSENNVEQLIFILVDVTERKLAEEKLRESEERLRLIAEAVHDVFWMVSPDWRKIHYVSPGFEKMWGCAFEEQFNSSASISDKFFERICPEDRISIENLKTLSLNGQPLEAEFRIIRPDGDVRWVHGRGFPILDENGVVKFIAGVLTDITNRKQMEEDLIRSNKDLEQFAYVASHDLQEPLRNVASCTQLLEKKHKDKLDGSAQELMKYAVESVKQMQMMIQDLLTYSRISTRKKPREIIDCQKILEQSLSNLRLTINRKSAIVTYDKLPTIAADSAQLVQVFQNLVGNALKFNTENPPQVHVSAVQKGNEWIFSVRDNGIGIEPEYLDRIFEIFQRLHKNTEYSGTGIGLAIVKKIIDRHQGRIWVESQVGKGTTFYFAIPVKKGNDLRAV